MAPLDDIASPEKEPRSFPGWLLPALIVGAVWALAIRQLHLEWSINPQYQYGWIVPVLTLLLWQRAWPLRPSRSGRLLVWTWPCLVALSALLAVPVRIIEEANPEWRVLDYYFTGQAILITALLLDCSGGKRWLRHFAFPLLFPLVAVPWPSGPETAIIQGLQRDIAGISVEAASWMGWRAIQSGSLIILSHGIVGINEACSGIRSLQSSLMCALFLGEYLRLTTGRRWLLILLALVAAFVLNCIRAFFLMATMELHGEAALLKIHDPAGLGIALFNLLLLWSVGNWWARPVPTAPAIAHEKIRLLFSAQGLVFLLAVWFAAELLNQEWYRWHERHTQQAVLWTLHWPPSRSDFTEEPIDDVARSYLRYDEGVHGKWHDERFQWELFFFTWKPNRGSAGLAQSHRPDICMPASGFIMKEELGVEEMEINGVRLPVSRYVFQAPYSGRLLYVFQSVTNDRIWKDNSVVPTLVPNATQRLLTAWAGRRNLGQRSLLMVNQGAGSLEEAESAMQRQLKDLLVQIPGQDQ